MKNPITKPLARLLCRWRTASALGGLDARLLKDIGQEVKRSPFERLNIVLYAHFLGRLNK